VPEREPVGLPEQEAPSDGPEPRPDEVQDDDRRDETPADVSESLPDFADLDLPREEEEQAGADEDADGGPGG